ncbi:hypothetical protein AAHA92_02823 [Salvia divinorum]|uniref:Uncharacterized protein n=1 Tax=Salvia divinorum TaxID=28513 RepID=A0ABD1IF48_SALDI
MTPNPTPSSSNQRRTRVGRRGRGRYGRGRRQSKRLRLRKGKQSLMGATTDSRPKGRSGFRCRGKKLRRMSTLSPAASLPAAPKSGLRMFRNNSLVYFLDCIWLELQRTLIGYDVLR